MHMGHATGKGSFSARFELPVLERLAARARRTPHANKSRLAERYVDEGMRMDDHPGIVFREGPMGRRAGLARGPDVWEIIDALKRQGRRGEPAIRDLAAALDLEQSQIRAALDYYDEFREEIDDLIERNRQAAAQAEESWRRQQATLR
jgi:uncharacterized protein (DUF433 family)